MNYDLKKAVSRFQFRFSKDSNGNFKTFKPNQEDVNAINTILGWISRNKKENVLNNSLLAKLYIYHLTMNIRHYETTVLDPIPQRDLSRLLEKPLSSFVDAFYRDLHDNQLNKLAKTNDKLEQAEIVKQYTEYKETFTVQFIEGKLFDMVSEVINRFQ